VAFHLSIVLYGKPQRYRRNPVSNYLDVFIFYTQHSMDELAEATGSSSGGLVGRACSSLGSLFSQQAGHPRNFPHILIFSRNLLTLFV
jgi:hypothetical protein